MVTCLYEWSLTQPCPPLTWTEGVYVSERVSFLIVLRPPEVILHSLLREEEGDRMLGVDRNNKIYCTCTVSHTKCYRAFSHNRDFLSFCWHCFFLSVSLSLTLKGYYLICAPLVVASRNKTDWAQELNYKSKYIHKPWCVISLFSTTELGILLKASAFRSHQSHGLAGQLQLFKWQDTSGIDWGLQKQTILFSQQETLLKFVEWVVNQSWCRCMPRICSQSVHLHAL